MLMCVRMDRIRANPRQPRKRFDEGPLRELAASIKKNGLMQPITVRPTGEEDTFEIVAGERRWRAHQIIAAEEITCNVQKMDDQTMALQAIVENLQRVDVTPLEEARALSALSGFGLSEAAIADKLGVPEFRVREKLSILRLEEQIQKLVDRGHVSVTAGYEIAKLPPNGQVKLMQKMAGGNIKNINEIRAAVQTILDMLAQQDAFAGFPAPTAKELATVKSLEAKIDAIVAMVNAGFKDGECVVARKVAPDRTRLMADKCAALRTALSRMERQLREAASQAEIALVDVA